MMSGDGLRLTLISLVLLIVQLGLLIARPEWRTGLDIYLVWLLIVSAGRGAGTGALLALLGGAVMDAGSIFGPFHTLFYLLPVAIGALFTAHLITEYNLLAALITGGLLLLKLLAMLVIAWAGGGVPGPSYLFKLNFLPLLVCCILVFLLWQRMTGLVPAQRAAGLGR